MQRTWKKALTLLLALVMLAATVACGNAAEPAAADASAPADEATQAEGSEVVPENASDAEGETPTTTNYNIGYNNLGAGVFSLDHAEAECRNLVETLLAQTMSAKSADFTADQLQMDCQSLVSSGIDGMMYFATYNTLTPTISDLFQENEVPFAIWDQAPYDEAAEKCANNPYYCGGIISDHYARGQKMAELCYEQGCRNVLLLGGAVGDTSHDLRCSGFADRFAELGGTILMNTRCASPSEATEKAEDMVAAFADTVDGAWGSQADFSLALYNACINQGLVEKVKFYSCEVNPSLLEYVADGAIITDSGVRCASLAATLLINYLDGHPITGPDGKAPVLPMGAFVVDKDNAAEFNWIWYTELPYTMETYEQLLWRYNPDVNYQTYVDWLDNFSWEYVQSLHDYQG